MVVKTVSGINNAKTATPSDVTNRIFIVPPLQKRFGLHLGYPTLRGAVIPIS